MSDRANQILIALLASRLVPWVQKLTGVQLSIGDVGDLFAGGIILWHTAAASFCAVSKRIPWLAAAENPTQPPPEAKANP